MQTDNMQQEADRLRTFKNWPVAFLQPETFAKNGFYYLGRGDEVRCAFCKVEIYRFEEGDDPAEDHMRFSPRCPFLNSQCCIGNVENVPAVIEGRDECGIRAGNSTGLTEAAHPRYAVEIDRLKSFRYWPRSMRQKPEKLADAGFFYTGMGDRVKCFYCDGGLMAWKDDSVPWEVHARYFKHCAYLQLVKGRDYVQRVITEACLIRDVQQKKEQPVFNEKESNALSADSGDDDKSKCKICYAEESNVCFVPCGHVVTCAKCALSFKSCPLCRKIVENTIRLYFP